MEITKKPISGLLPIRNSISWLNNIEKSILPSLRSCDELIIVDDNSNDGTLEQLYKLEKKYANIKVLRNPKNGLCAALNYGIKSTRLEFIARYDVDDIYSESRIENQVKAIDNNTVAIFTDYEIFSDKKKLGTVFSPIFPMQTSISLINSERTAHPSVLLRKNAVLDVGGYRNEDFPAEDLSLWLRIIEAGEIKSIGTTELKWRLHTRSTTSNFAKEIFEKTNSLISQNEVLANRGRTILENFDFYFSQYDNSSQHSMRQMLFLRDFAKAQKLLNLSKTENSLMTYILRAFEKEKIEFLKSTNKLFISKIRRDLFRKKMLRMR